MATVTGMTAAAMQEIADGVVVDGEVNENGDLILTRHDGSWFNAGHVKGPKGNDATALLLPADTNTVDLSRTGTGTEVDPWVLKADLVNPRVLMQLAGDYIGPGPAYVTAIGDGLGTKYGPFEWVGPYDPIGNPVVSLVNLGGAYVITGHAAGNTLGGWRAIPLDPDWIPYGLRNAGTRYGAFTDQAYVVKSTIGIVSLQGLYVARTAKGVGAIITTLPPGYRPDVTLVFQSNVSDTVGEVRVNPDGTVITQGAIPANQWVNLSGIAFPAAGVASWTPITTWLNGFSDFGQIQFGVASYWVDPYGVCWWSGLVKIGTTGGVHMFSLPPGVTPLDAQHETVAGQSQTFTAVRFTGSATAGGPTGWLDWLSGPGSGGWLSLAGLTTVTPSGFTTLAPYTFDPNVQTIMQNSWASYGTVGGGNQVPLLIKRPDNLAMGIGLIRSGTVGSYAFGIPERFLPRYSLLMAAPSAVARGRLDIIGSNVDAAGTTYQRSLLPAQGSNTWFALDGSKWVPGG